MEEGKSREGGSETWRRSWGWKIGERKDERESWGEGSKVRWQRMVAGRELIAKSGGGKDRLKKMMEGQSDWKKSGRGETVENKRPATMAG
ncbi:hypothetical protein Pcinc_024744 [Petrolisthes cinctipes]|uniref:Uncharacterized protein n=1 Tax=Petrolisthes cinctipes TaxID=88211 RepID=A0AAE1F9W1_PETCI|nr:hypothetical protein Pcinc_024744 [Petrolisthes cinctipes]